ncbi:hypothetical protein diail_2348 [Diaporthe ilicicola]|nr:hypothetical protein diail_2348 [Diaporthe ilicicola]
MQPFDDISSTELGFEDDILSPDMSSAHDRYLNGIPKWMRPSGSRSSASILDRIRHDALPAVIKWTTAAIHRLTPILLSILRPRLTVRYVTFSIAALWVTWRFLISQPLFASKLPGYTGPYSVGALDVEYPLETPRRVSDVRFKSKSDGDYAFEVETVLFTLYYPTSHAARGASTAGKYYWFPKPVSATAKGYARFLGMDNVFFRGILTGGLWLVASGIQIPAKVGAPLIPPAEQLSIKGSTDGDLAGVADGEGGKLPVMVFTHGMLSSRTDYTHYLGELASRGVVVAAIEHRDGSSPASPITKPGKGPRWRYAFGLKDLARPSSEDGRHAFDTPALKEAQLSFREAEIEATLDVLRALDTGSSPSTTPVPNSRQPVGTDMSSFKARLDTAHPTIAGHSFGGTGALRALRPSPDGSASSSSSSRLLPFSGAVVLDPGKSSGPLNADVGSVPLAICHSSTWSKGGPGLFYGRPHFEVVRGIADRANNNNRTTGGESKEEREDADGWGGRRRGGGGGGGGGGGWFLTSLGTSHPSITDAPLLEPLLLSWATGSTMDARDGIMQYVLATRDFIRYQHTGERHGLLALSGRAKEEGGVASREYDPRHNEGMPERWRKYWQIHVAPE